VVLSDKQRFVARTGLRRTRIEECARKLLREGVKVRVTKVNLGSNPVLTVKTGPYMILDSVAFVRDMEGHGIELSPLTSEVIDPLIASPVDPAEGSPTSPSPK
jgi:hypothetical protein